MEVSCIVAHDFTTWLPTEILLWIIDTFIVKRKKKCNLIADYNPKNALTRECVIITGIGEILRVNNHSAIPGFRRAQKTLSHFPKIHFSREL